MTAPSDLYRACAAQSREDAAQSTLANVRDRHLRSASAWQAMADRAALMESARLERDAAALARKVMA